MIPVHRKNYSQLFDKAYLDVFTFFFFYYNFRAGFQFQVDPIESLKCICIFQCDQWYQNVLYEVVKFVLNTIKPLELDSWLSFQRNDLLSQITVSSLR